MKTKMREKVRPKMGKIDIDYQKLHDAFFKWQMKPKLTIHGDLYYEVLPHRPLQAALSSAPNQHAYTLASARNLLNARWGKI